MNPCTGTSLEKEPDIACNKYKQMLDNSFLYYAVIP